MSLKLSGVQPDFLNHQIIFIRLVLFGGIKMPSDIPRIAGECQDEAYLKTSEKDEAISPNPRMLGIIRMICETLRRFGDIVAVVERACKRVLVHARHN